MRFRAILPRLTRPLLLFIIVAIALGGFGCSSAASRGWSGPLLANNVLYMGTIQDALVACDAAGGAQQWAVEMGTGQAGAGAFSCMSCGRSGSNPMSMYGTPVLWKDEVYVGGYDGKVRRVSRDGRAVGAYGFDTGSSIVGGPTVDGDTLYVGNSDGRVYALDLTVRDFSDSAREGWPFRTGGEIWSTPVVKDGVVYVASADHNLYAIDARTGNEIWRFKTEGAVMSTPLVADGMVYIGSCDRKFYAVRAATEQERLAAGIDGYEPAERLYEAVFEGAKNWFWTQALAYNGQIWVGCLDHKVYVLNAGTLEYIGEVQTDGLVYAPPVAVNGAVVVGSRDGLIYVIDPDTASGTVRYAAYAISPDDAGDVFQVYSIDGTGAVVKSTEEPGFTASPILAPIQVDEPRNVVYFHAQDGQHVLHAFSLTTRQVLWSLRTDDIGGQGA